MAWTNSLPHLQKVDLALEKLRQQVADIEARLRDNRELREARESAEEKTTVAQQAARAQKDEEFALNRVETEHQQVETRLYGGGIRNPRELSDLQAKAESLKHRKSQLEDRLLEAMLAREEADDQLAKATAKLKALEERWEVEHAQLTVHQAQLHSEIAAREEEANALQQDIPPAILDTYQHLRARMGGIAVAHLKGDVCSICGMVVTSQSRQSANQGKETYCSGCGRLLIGW